MEQGIDTSQSTSRPMDGVIGRSQAINQFVPYWIKNKIQTALNHAGELTRRRAREDDLAYHSREIHISESSCPKLQSLVLSISCVSSPEPEGCSHHKRCSKVNDAIRQPSQYVKHRVGIPSKDIRDIPTVQYRL